MKEHFKEYDDIALQIREQMQKLAEIEANLYNAKAINYDLSPKGTNINKDESLLLQISKKDDVIKKIEILEKKKKELTEIYTKEINKMDDVRYRSIIRCKFLDWKSNQQISDILMLSRPHTNRLIKEAIKEFKICNNL